MNIVSKFQCKQKLFGGFKVLDDANYITQVDKQNALSVAGQQADQLKYEFGVTVHISTPIANVVLGGMGGSAWPAQILSTWPTTTVPFEISRDYHVPSYVNAQTLYIASSYSGNTEETIASLEDAAQKGAQIVVITSGGKLLELAEAKGYSVSIIPSGFQPRMSSFYFLAALIQILEPLKLVKVGSTKELLAAAEWLKPYQTAWQPSVPTSSNYAKQLAEKIEGKTAIIYSGPLMFPAAHKWKICLNENAKNLAWANQYPELNHNEFIGWSSHPIEKPFAVVEIRSNLEHPRIQKRFELTDKLLSGKKPHAISIQTEGETALKQVLWAYNLGDFVSLYLAVLNNVDPTPVDLVEKLKAELG